MTAISISNAVDWLHREEREAEYMKIVARYDRQQIDLFPQMFAHLVEELERHAEALEDVLGKVFHELELHNKYKGQFFTPQHMCDMMGLIAAGDTLPERGYHSVCEPCVGSGAMVLGLANAIQKNGHDFHRHMVVTATDIDLKCVHMCYLQLSLYGIPAVVIHGNGLTLEEWSRWYTPVYMLDGWVWRQSCGNLDKRYPEDEAIKRASEPMYAAVRDVEALIGTATPEQEETPQAPEPEPALQVTKHGQLTLF